ncbi:MAG: DEAD/DEAH box helicase [Alphaproteobacteria bacterium]|nr:MAG: DEAD/DEAH box helicase [Alphaproteobacteria bacterium]
MNGFEELGLSTPLLDALEASGYENPTPVQAQAIPPVLEGRDLIATAATGTGKTAAFVLPLLERLAAARAAGGRRVRPGTARILVLTPTRELAGQITDAVRRYGRHISPRTAVIVGGQKMGPQFAALRGGLDILVATPGRLIDHIERGSCRLDETQVLVLDEADQMLDLGFLPPIRRIAALLAEERQTLLFSATMPKAIRRLAGELLTQPAEVTIGEARSPAEAIEQRLVRMPQAEKRSYLVDLLKAEKAPRAIVFTRTKRGAERLHRQLERAGCRSAAIHGDKNQSQRQRALDAFRRGRVEILVATDVAARGIDVRDVTHVVNFDLPQTAESYVHRIGRTARAGKTGIAITLCDASESGLLSDIERLIGVHLSADGSTRPFEGGRESKGRGKGQAYGRGRRPRRQGRPARRRAA